MENYDCTADVWSFGVTGYIMLYGVFPYMPSQMTSEAMKKAIVDGVPCPAYKPAEANLEWSPSDGAVHLLRAALVRRPEVRSSAVACLDMPFMRDAALQAQRVEQLAAEKAGHQPAVSERSESETIKHVLSKGRQVTKNFDSRPDPTIQRNLDELLAQLQQNFSRGQSVTRSFSLQVDASPLLPEKVVAEGDGSRRSGRASTHSGEIKMSKFFDDDVSTASGSS